VGSWKRAITSSDGVWLTRENLAKTALLQYEIISTILSIFSPLHAWKSDRFFYYLLQAETVKKSVTIFALCKHDLGKYHARDIHEWERGQCDFHMLRKYTCGSYENDVTCKGEDYHTKNPLTCPFHALVYEIECCSRADQASSIIHTELGRGQSNYPEASHNVLVRFRSKEKYLHYMKSTNLGLLQANMIWLGKKSGLPYHWLLELFTHLKLPLFDGIIEALKTANEIHAKNLAKNKQIKLKINRLIGRKLGCRCRSRKKENSGVIGKQPTTHMVRMIIMKMKNRQMKTTMSHIKEVQVAQLPVRHVVD